MISIHKLLETQSDNEWIYENLEPRRLRIQGFFSFFPAHAGVIPGLGQLMRGEICFSRTRGGNPCRSAKIPFQKE